MRIKITHLWVFHFACLAPPVVHGDGLVRANEVALSRLAMPLRVDIQLLADIVLQ